MNVPLVIEIYGPLEAALLFGLDLKDGRQQSDRVVLAEGVELIRTAPPLERRSGDMLTTIFDDGQIKRILEEYKENR